MSLINRVTKVGFALSWAWLFHKTTLIASSLMTIEKAQQIYQENPTSENWGQLSALQTQARINEIYPYLLIGLIFLYVVMRMIFSSRIKKIG